MTEYGWPNKGSDEELRQRIMKMRDRRYASVFKKKMRAKTKKERVK